MLAISNRRRMITYAVLNMSPNNSFCEGQSLGRVAQARSSEKRGDPPTRGRDDWCVFRLGCVHRNVLVRQAVLTSYAYLRLEKELS